MKPENSLADAIAYSTQAPALSTEFFDHGSRVKPHTSERWSGKHRLSILLFPITCLIIFSTLVLMLNDGVISRNNYWAIQVDWFVAMNAYLSSWPVLFANLTQLGDGLILMPMLSFLIVWRPKAWAAVFGAIPLGLLLSAGGKYLAAVPRPAVVLDPDAFTVVGSALKGYHSLPSGHTITVFVVATAILFTLVPIPRTTRQYSFLIMGFLVAAVLSISRIAVGVHWPLDIVAGAALGYLAGLSGVILTQRYQHWWHWLNAEKYQFILCAILFAWSFGLFKRVFKHSDNTSIVIWVAATIGLITSLYLLKRYVTYLFLNSQHQN